MKRILLDGTPHEKRVALVEDGELMELVCGRRDTESIVGNMYVARVENVLPGMKAAFLDIGGEKNAYYYYGSRDPEREKAQKPQIGAQMLVQVEKPGTATKGPVVTTKLSFPGKFLVLLPGEKGDIGISRRITETPERDRIRTLVGKLLPPGHGAVVRTDGMGRDEGDYKAEMERLCAVSQKVLETASYRKAPFLVYRELDPVLKAVRDLWTEDVEEVVVNDKTLFGQLQEMQALYGEAEKKLTFYEKAVPLFGEYHIETQVEKAFHKKVWLKSGGFLIIEQTEACVVIDVNTGKFTGKKDIEATFFKTNQEAALEIAKQLRLRNLSGLIIVDFIDLKEEADKKALQQLLLEAVSRDRVKTVVVGMTELGLMQLTRKKTGPSLRQTLTEVCPVCGGNGAVPSVEQVAAKAGREIATLFAQTIYDQAVLTAQKSLLEAFAGPDGAYQKALEAKYGKKIVLCASAEIPAGTYRLSGEKQGPRPE